MGKKLLPVVLCVALSQGGRTDATEIPGFGAPSTDTKEEGGLFIASTAPPCSSTGDWSITSARNGVSMNDWSRHARRITAKRGRKASLVEAERIAALTARLFWHPTAHPCIASRCGQCSTQTAAADKESAK